MIKVGLIGYGKAGQAVAEVLKEDPRFELVWVAKRNPWPEDQPLPLGLPVFAMSQGDFGEWLDAHPVDALVDFSDADTIHLYGEEVRKRHLTLVSAISAYSDESLAYARSLGEQARVLCSPNITLGINFVLVASRLMQRLAPYADVEVVEEHFRDKPETSGTALKLASALGLDPATQVNSIRVGGIVGRHEVIFGLPNQTIRLIHESISGKAFGQGAMFAARWLAQQPTGRYTMEEAVRATFAATLADDLAAQPAEHVTELI